MARNLKAIETVFNALKQEGGALSKCPCNFAANNKHYYNRIYNANNISNTTLMNEEARYIHEQYIKKQNEFITKTTIRTPQFNNMMAKDNEKRNNYLNNLMAKKPDVVHYPPSSTNSIGSNVFRTINGSRYSTSGQTIQTESEADYAFEMATSTVRFGEGVTKEVGADMKEMACRHVCLMTDHRLSSLLPVQTVIESLKAHNVKFTLYDQVRVEPTDKSFKDAIRFATDNDFDAFIAVGGGSVIDTCKAANLYSSFPPPGDTEEEQFLHYVNPPIGKGSPPPGNLKPLVAVPTTAGTGSETTGVSIFDMVSMRAKTGIAHRRLKPTLGIIDPINTYSMNPELTAASGFDVLSHSIESYTAIHYNERTPKPASPLLRPAYQGSNPISDVWSAKALEMVAQYLPIAFHNPADKTARGMMMLASTYAGVGFGNAGVHLPHGMSYPVAGNASTYTHPNYDFGRAIIPHGVSVIVHAPAVFRFTSGANPARHRECARLLGATNTDAVADDDTGRLLSDKLLEIMRDLRIPNGLSAMGYSDADIPALVEGTLPQERVTRLAPKRAGSEELAQLFKESMVIY